MHSRSAVSRAALLCGFLCSVMSLPALCTTPPVNPFLSAPVNGIAHIDSSQGDTFPYAVGTGTAYVDPLAIPQLIAPLTLVSLASTSPNYMWSASPTEVAYIKVSGGQFTPVAVLPDPGQTGLAANTLAGILNQPFTSIAQIQSALSGLNITASFGGVYSLVDNNNVLYSVYGTRVMAFQATQVPLLGTFIVSNVRTLDASTFLGSGESLAALGMTFDGYLVVLGSRSVTVVSRDFSTVEGTVAFGSNESITNSLAVDQNGGIYAVTDQMMHKVVWINDSSGKRLSSSAADGAWQAAYPTGATFPTIFGSGSGSTPALMGFGDDPDKLVVITDGAARMDLIAFWRDAIPAGFTSRIAGVIPVTCGLPPSTTYIQSDQSVAVNGYGAFVVNNVSTGDVQYQTLSPVVRVLARGPVYASAYGVERFQWSTQTHSWTSVWNNPAISDNSMIPTISGTSNMVLVSGYYPNSGWEVTGLDWNSGAIVHRTVFGQLSAVGNGSYAEIQYLSNGDLMFNGLIGVTRVQEPSGLVLPPLL